MSSAAIGALAASVIMPIVIAILARLFPSAEVDRPGPSLEDLHPDYAKWESFLALTALVCSVPIALVLWLLLRRLSDWHASLLPRGAVTLTAMPIYWMVPAMLLAMLVAAPVVTVFARSRLKDRYGELERYYALKYRCDQARVTRLFGYGTAIVGILAILLGLNWYVVISEDVVVLNRFLSLTEERHPVGTITGIRSAPKVIAPNGKVVDRREYVVTFAQGPRWSTDSLPADLNEAEKGALMRGLARTSGIAIEEVALFQKGEW